MARKATFEHVLQPRARQKRHIATYDDIPSLTAFFRRVKYAQDSSQRSVARPTIWNDCYRQLRLLVAGSDHLHGICTVAEQANGSLQQSFTCNVCQCLVSPETRTGAASEHVTANLNGW